MTLSILWVTSPYPPPILTDSQFLVGFPLGLSDILWPAPLFCTWSLLEFGCSVDRVFAHSRLQCTRQSSMNLSSNRSHEPQHVFPYMTSLSCLMDTFTQHSSSTPSHQGTFESKQSLLVLYTIYNKMTWTTSAHTQASSGPIWLPIFDLLRPNRSRSSYLQLQVPGCWPWHLWVHRWMLAGPGWQCGPCI